MGFSRQEHWSGLPFPSPVDHILSGLQLLKVFGAFSCSRYLDDISGILVVPLLIIIECIKLHWLLGVRWSGFKEKSSEGSGNGSREGWSECWVMAMITTEVWSLTWSKTSWNAKSSGLWEASLTKLEEIMEFHMSYFKSLKMIQLMCCTHCTSKFGKLSSGHGTGKGQFSLKSQRKAMPKNAQTIVQLLLLHMLARLCSKSFKLGFCSMWTENFRCTTWI